MRIDLRKVFLVLAMVAVLIAIGIVIGINININREYPRMMAKEDAHNWEFGAAEEGRWIYDNFWNYIGASYIIVGTPPDCQFYKIASELDRNNYNPEQFYEDSDEKKYYHNSDGERESVLVIDVSEFQGSVDWERVKADGVKGVMLRVGYRGYGSGKLVLDSRFEENIEGARDAGLKVGVYFYTQGISYEEGVEEARFVLDNIKGYKLKYPVAIDTEALYEADARTSELDNEARTDVVVGFCDTIRDAGYEPMIYTNRNWLVQCLDNKRLTDMQIWYAHYTTQPDLPYLYRGWQYTDEGHVDGVGTNVDLNVWFD